MKIAMAVGLLLAVYGAAELLHGVLAWLLRPCAEQGGYWLIPVQGNGESAEWLIRYARWRCRNGVQPVLFDNGLTPHGEVLVRAVCRRMQVDFWPKTEEQKIEKMALQDTGNTL